MNNKDYILKLIEQFASADPSRIALKLYDGQNITDIPYQDLAAEILCRIGFFRQNGISGKHIALIGPNSRDWITAFFAITGSGNVAVPMNPSLPREALLGQCEMADVSVVCGAEEISGLSTELPCFSYRDLRSDEVLSLQDLQGSAEDAVALLMFTSGTTGESKIAEITHGSLSSSIRSADGVFSVPETERVMPALPLFHIAGLRGVLAMLSRYKTLCIGRGIMYLFKDMPVFSPTYVQLVPMIADSIVKIIKHVPRGEARRKYFGGDLKRICVGGATIDAATCRYLMEEGFIIDSGYAMTETTGVGTWGQWDAEHLNTIGKLSDELQCRIVNGELLFKGPAVMKGYYKDPAATEAVLQDGWLHSGDLGFCDQDGYYYITGRKKNLIVMSNGEKVNPEELEGYFLSCDAIAECMVYSRGSVICMDVSTKKQEAAREFIEAYNRRMPMSHRVRKIKYHQGPLQKTDSGKLVRKENAQ